MAGSRGDLAGLRVALVLATSGGGVGRNVVSLAEGLTGRGVRVLVVGPASTEKRFGFRQAGASFVPVEVAQRPRPLRDARAVVRLRRLTRGCDVVHAHGLRAGGLVSLTLTRKPLIVTLHNAVLSGGLVGTIYGMLERLVAARAEIVLGVSADLVERARRLGARNTERALVAAPPLARPRHGRTQVRAELGAGDRPLVLSVGRLAEQKGFTTLLDAARRWAKRQPAPLVAIVGDGPLEHELAGRVSAESLPVRLLGRRDDVADLLAVADVVAVPSVWEGQPLAVQEALRAGAPLVATAVGGIPEMAGEGALLVPAGDAGALAETVARVLDEPDLARRLAAAARERGDQLPTEPDTIDQMARIYRTVVTDGKPIGNERNVDTG